MEPEPKPAPEGITEEGVPPTRATRIVATVQVEISSLLDGWEPRRVAKWLLNRTGDPVLESIVVSTATDGSRLARIDDELKDILQLDTTLYRKIKMKVQAMERSRQDELRMSFTDVVRNESEREAAAARIPASSPSACFEPEPEPESTYTDVEGVTLYSASGQRYTGKLRISRLEIQHLIRDGSAQGPDLAGRLFAAVLPLHLIEQSKTKVIPGDNKIELTLSVNRSEFYTDISLEFPDKSKRILVERMLQLEKADRDWQRDQSSVQGSLTVAGVRWDVEKQDLGLDAMGDALSTQQSSRATPDKIEIKGHMQIPAARMMGGAHVEFVVECVSARYGSPWQVTKRYNDFVVLKKLLLDDRGEFSLPVEGCPFPASGRNPDLDKRQLELVNWSNAVLRVVQAGVATATSATANYRLAQGHLEAFFGATDGVAESKRRVQNPDDPQEGWGVVIPAMPKGVNCQMLDQYCGEQLPLSSFSLPPAGSDVCCCCRWAAEGGLDLF